MSTDVKTPYLDLHHRVIYKSSRGAYYVKDAAGKKYYGVKAYYVAVVNGTSRKLTTNNATPPNKIAPKRIAAPKVRTSTRKVRSNIGLKRKAYKPRSKTPKVSPSTNGNGIQVTRFTFRVELSGNQGDYDVETQSDALKVCAWYKDINSHEEKTYNYITKTWKQGGELAERIMYEPMFVTVQKTRFGTTYTEKQFRIKVTVYAYDDARTNMFVDFLKGLIDPDDDGNQPITMNRKKYLVNGYDFKLV